MTPALLQGWVTRQADRRPDAVAVMSAAGRLTYAELDTLSTRLGRLLQHAGCQRGDRLALLMPKSPLAIAGLLGIYKADGICVPLDLASPAGRLGRILEACDCRWVLAAAGAAPLLHELLREHHGQARLSIGWLDPQPPEGGIDATFTLDDALRFPAAPVQSRSRPNDPAHLLFTSGSTGTPKGVVITHANVIHFIKWAVAYFGMTASDRVSAHPPLHFDLSFFDIFATAAAGGELHLVPPEINVLPNKLADFIRQSELTQWFSVPSVLTYMARFNVVGFGDFPRLRRVLWCGDVLPTPTLIYWMERVPHVTFTNLYGPTETTIASSYYTVTACPADPQAAIPIGSACDGEELFVFDDSMHRVPRGLTGELYIGGAGVTLGYWGDSERTAEAFVPHPERPSERIYRTGDLARIGDDGLVYFLGRRDTQIKSRGYRIELGEIESALNTIEGVQECAVVAIDTHSFEGALICCAYVPAPGSGLTAITLRRALGRLVPAYMLPARWRAFDELPRNANGKTDRRRLRDTFQERC